MKFRNRNKKNEENKNNEKIEIVMGDDSELEISSVGDCMNELRPKENEKKNVVIPKAKRNNKI